MKKISFLVITMFLMLGLAVASANPWDYKQVPGGEPLNTTKMVSYITITFINGKTGTLDVSEVKGEDKETTIENKLKEIWDKEYDIKQITYIDGVKIENTKFAKYGGVIRTKDPTEVGSGEGNDSGGLSKPDSNGEVKVGDQTYEPFEVTVKIDGEMVEFADAKPMIASPSYRTMVPMRAVFEHKNVQADVKWDEKKKTVTATNNEGRTVIFTIGNKEYLVIAPDGSVKTLWSDAAPVIVKNRTLLPLRALGAAYGIETLWFDDQKLVDMKTTEDYKKHLLPDWQPQ